MQANPAYPPRISFIIPTLNASKHIGRCLDSIARQRYSDEKIEILVVDGGSSDRTQMIARRYGAIVLQNPAKLAEHGKAIGIHAATGDLLVLMDADNEINRPDWLVHMIRPLLEDSGIAGVESNWIMNDSYSLVNRYCCLARLEDPISRRIALLENCASLEKRGSYDVYTVKPNRFPALGANGFLWRKSVFSAVTVTDSYDEHDFAASLYLAGYRKIANVKGYGIYHFHVESMLDFIKKRMRQPYLFFGRKRRKKEVWLQKYTKIDFILAVLYCATIIGPMVESVREYRKTKDKAWLLHPLMSFLTVVVYSVVTLNIKFLEFVEKIR